MTSRYWREWKRSKRETGAISSISDSPRAPIVICNDSGYVVLCFDASLHPRTDLLRPPQFDVGYELKQVLRRAIDREVQAQRLDDDDHVLFTMQHPAFLHAFNRFTCPCRNGANRVSGSRCSCKDGGEIKLQRTIPLGTIV